ncbi:MAG TPA: hypothetical protein VGF94_13945 [Kofleriaceae bacterium]
MSARAAAVVLVAASGCAQVLGLDSTHLDFKDAMTDAPNVCDGAPMCTSTTGRSVCGQLVQVGANAGVPLRVAMPTGAVCSATEGPCAFTVFGQAEASFFAGTTSDRVTGTIDDCGRFVAPDLDATQTDVVVGFSAASYNDVAALVLGRPMTPGSDTIAVYAVDAATAMAWATQASASMPPDTTTGLLVTHADTTGAPVATDKDRADGADLGAPPAVPWAGYFTGAAPFGALDPTATSTGPSGTSLDVPQSGSFMLSSARTGKTCTPMPMLQTVDGVLIELTLGC